jgi:hypothetical protein
VVLLRWCSVWRLLVLCMQHFMGVEKFFADREYFFVTDCKIVAPTRCSVYSVAGSPLAVGTFQLPITADSKSSKCATNSRPSSNVT